MMIGELFGVRIASEFSCVNIKEKATNFIVGQTSPHCHLELKQCNGQYVTYILEWAILG